MKRSNLKEFLEKVRKIHGDKYDYSKVEYKNSQTKVIIICPIHGEFQIIPDSLLRGRGCPLCGIKRTQMKNRMKQDVFLERAKKIQENKYDYSKVEYINTDTKVCIICPEHGEFWQTPHHHLNGVGCPLCGINNISENKLYRKIHEVYTDAVQQQSFDFLCENGHKQFIDIYIPSKQIGIEYQGRQHFVPISKFGGESEFLKTQLRDIKKYEKCKENGIQIFYFSYEKEIPSKYIDDIFINENKLIKSIEK